MKLSAGILVFRRSPQLEVFLVHPGGPFFAKKDVWGIPKGEYTEDELAEDAARREFAEETGISLPSSQLIDLGEVKTSNKNIHCFGIEYSINAKDIKSNYFEMEWPPRSGKIQNVPEIDKAIWMPATQAIDKMHKGQKEFVERLASHLKMSLSVPEPEQSSLF